MDEPVYSFVFDATGAGRAFLGIATRELVLSLLAGVTPEAEWEGCLVYEGASPMEAGTACIGTAGAGADAVQLRLIEALEGHGVDVLAVYDGGPEPRTPVARARAGRWTDPDR